MGVVRTNSGGDSNKEIVLELNALEDIALDDKVGICPKLRSSMGRISDGGSSDGSGSFCTDNYFVSTIYGNNSYYDYLNVEVFSKDASLFKTSLGRAKTYGNGVFDAIEIDNFLVLAHISSSITYFTVFNMSTKKLVSIQTFLSNKALSGRFAITNSKGIFAYFDKDNYCTFSISTSGIITKIKEIAVAADIYPARMIKLDEQGRYLCAPEGSFGNSKTMFDITFTQLGMVTNFQSVISCETKILSKLYENIFIAGKAIKVGTGNMHGMCIFKYEKSTGVSTILDEEALFYATVSPYDSSIRSFGYNSEKKIITVLYQSFMHQNTYSNDFRILAESFYLDKDGDKCNLIPLGLQPDLNRKGNMLSTSSLRQNEKFCCIVESDSLYNGCNIDSISFDEYLASKKCHPRILKSTSSASAGNQVTVKGIII